MALDEPLVERVADIGQHDADGVGPLADQGPCRGVRLVIQLFDRFPDLGGGLRVDLALAVQNPRNGAAGNAGQTPHVVDCCRHAKATFFGQIHGNVPEIRILHWKRISFTEEPMSSDQSFPAECGLHLGILTLFQKRCQKLRSPERRKERKKLLKRCEKVFPGTWGGLPPA